MSFVELALVPRIASGEGARARIGARAAALTAGRRALLVADPGLPAAAREDLATALREAGFAVAQFSEFSGDPTLAQCDAAAAEARSCDIVIALGGGSALDLGKAAACVAGGNAPAADYALCARDLPRGLPAVCVPTTSGTGSETTRTAVLSQPDKAKTWLWGDAMKAAEVVLDPALTATLPRALTACTAIDALVHAVEAATNRNASVDNNLCAYEAIRLVARHLPATLADPSDLRHRAALQRAATLAGIAIDNAGTAIAHNIGHALGSLAGLHHGRAVGVAMLASLPWNVEDDDGRWAACAAAMDAPGGAGAFVKAYEALLRDSFAEVALGATLSADILARQMARPENASMRASNWKASDDARLLALAEATLTLK